MDPSIQQLQAIASRPGQMTAEQLMAKPRASPYFSPDDQRLEGHHAKFLSVFSPGSQVSSEHKTLVKQVEQTQL